MNATEITLDPAPPPPNFRECGCGCLFALLFTGLVVGAVQVALVAGCASAPQLPEGALEFVTNYVDRIISGAGGASSQDAHGAHADSDVPQPGGDAGDAAEPASPNTAAAPAIAWKYGGVDGSKSAETAAARIGSLRIGSGGLSYKWEKGGCEALGATSRTDCDHTLACAFWWDGSRWIGGKFDWISTSRTTRDWKNISGRYHGWDPDKFFAAPKVAFCIMSADGRKRSNLIEGTWK